MRRLVRAAIGVALAFATVWSAPGSAGAVGGGAPDVPAPSAAADASVASIGQLVRVTGAGWGANVGDVVDVVVCGNAALDGPLDCDVANTAAGGVRSGGSFYTAISIHPPPYPCPCVLRVSSGGGVGYINLPLTVVGMPSATPVRHVVVVRSITVTNVHFEGGTSIASFFGGRPPRRIRYEITNTGNVVLHNPTVDVAWGRGTHPTGFVQTPQVGDLAPHETRAFNVRLPFTAFSIGSYRAVVRADPLGEAASGQATTSVIPWGLILLAVGVVQGALLWARARVRRRLRVADDLFVPEAGWYPDPLDESALRIWDGQRWTDHSRPAAPGAERAVAGWYRDPLAEGRLRLWDGSNWSDETMPTIGSMVVASGA